jgi:hypothetical protein
VLNTASTFQNLQSDVLKLGTGMPSFFHSEVVAILSALRKKKRKEKKSFSHLLK